MRVPNPLANVAASLEKGEAVDWRKVAQLQAVTIVSTTVDYLNAHLAREDEEHERTEQLLSTKQ